MHFSSKDGKHKVTLNLSVYEGSGLMNDSFIREWAYEYAQKFPPMKTNKCLVILSGGLDSTVLLYHLIKEGFECHALGVNYGQRHGKELAYAQASCVKLGIPFELADLTAITHLLGGSSQTDPSLPVPEGHYAADSMKLTVVPNRNMIMLSIAMGYAISLKLDFIAFGAHAGDHTIYPDCRPEFADKMDDIAQICDWHKLRLVRPFIHKTKTDIVQLGHELGVPFEDTWSCYKGGEIHCGVCGTCQERRGAFVEAGVVDPTVYEQTPTIAAAPEDDGKI